MMTGKNDDAARVGEDSFLGELSRKSPNTWQHSTPGNSTPRSAGRASRPGSPRTPRSLAMRSPRHRDAAP